MKWENTQQHPLLRSRNTLHLSNYFRFGYMQVIIQIRVFFRHPSKFPLSLVQFYQLAGPTMFCVAFEYLGENSTKRSIIIITYWSIYLNSNYWIDCKMQVFLSKFTIRSVLVPVVDGEAQRRRIIRLQNDSVQKDKTCRA